jgi:branched-subunit amino acid aminotransferase/4-amino-4-deoxychorismate lyase
MYGLINGQIVPLEAAQIPIWDLGFAQGVSVTEQLRTLGGKLWLVESHLRRLEQGLRLAWLTWPAELGKSPLERLSELLDELAARSLSQLEPGDDIGLCAIVTAGDHPRFRDAAAEPLQGSRLAAHTFRLPHAEQARRHTGGVRLVTVPTREIPAECLDRRLKSRSRMHYWIAQRQAEFAVPGSQALLLDVDGNVAESPAATIVAIDGRTRSCLVPPPAAILPGASLDWFLGLAGRFQLEVVRKPLSVADLQASSEVLSLSTPGVIAPVVEVDGQRIGDGKAVGGEIYWRVVVEVGDTTGVDLINQSRRFATS